VPLEEKSMPAKECPMCGEFMKLRDSTITDRIPGTSTVKTTTTREWICPECDYFEEAEGLGDMKGE
jgi:hypothetical protein